MDRIYDIPITKSDGQETTLKEYSGKTLLLVNVASNCDYTHHYVGLQKLYEQYKGMGFAVLAFPCNDFGGQEPGTMEEIIHYCLSKYGVKFDIFQKITIVGQNQHPLYKFLVDQSPEHNEVKWNFEKFLISRDGRILNRFVSNVAPEALELRQALEKDLFDSDLVSHEIGGI
jgi:glutathione peroxidase